MKKDEKGVSMPVLILTIVVILILVISTIFIGKNIMIDAKIGDVATDILLIQAKVKTISEKVDFDSKATDLVKGREISLENQGDKEILEKLNINEVNSMKRILSKQDLEEWGLQNIAEDGKYLVDYKTSKIYYIPGVKDKENNIMYDSDSIITKSKEIVE